MADEECKKNIGKDWFKPFRLRTGATASYVIKRVLNQAMENAKSYSLVNYELMTCNGSMKQTQ